MLQVTVNFEETVYSYELPLSATLNQLKLKIQHDTNIIPSEQMLIENTTHMDLPDDAQLAPLAVDAQVRAWCQPPTPRHARFPNLVCWAYSLRSISSLQIRQPKGAGCLHY